VILTCFCVWILKKFVSGAMEVAVEAAAVAATTTMGAAVLAEEEVVDSTVSHIVTRTHVLPEGTLTTAGVATGKLNLFY
jgi:hypothetical protein